jgi:formiminotetrahydrofolate cyclodeaminase
VTQPADYLDRRLRDLLDDMAEQTPAPAGGSAAAIAVALAAALVAMTARFSREHWEEAGGVIAQAEALRSRVAPLAQKDAEAYGRALAAFRLPKSLDPAARDEALGRALAEAAAVPLEIASVAADVAVLAAAAAERGNPNVRGDAATAAALAEAGARAAANLVAINLGALEDDERVTNARGLAATATSAAAHALAQGS